MRAALLLPVLLALPFDRPADDEGFRFVDVEEGRELRLGERVLWRHLTTFDPERLEETYKPYTELLAADGTALTKRHGGLYPHHRGLFLGWNRVTVGGARHDLWSMNGNTRPTQHHIAWVDDAEVVGEGGATCAMRTEWRAGDGTPLVRDERTYTTGAPHDGRWVLDVEVRLEALVDDLTLDGDPRHGGLQVRLAQECAERKDVVYTRPEGAEGVGNDDWLECGWVLATYTIGEAPHAIAILDHPDNPRPTTYNTRNYGRFGPFFRAPLPKEAPLDVRYRVVLWDLAERGAPDAAELDALLASMPGQDG